MTYAGHSSAAVFFDYDRDGRLDLFLVNVGRYITNTIGGDGNSYYVAFDDAFSGHLKVFDFNNDGRLDIFITDMHSDMSETIPPEREKLKSDMKWPVSFRGTGRTSIWGNAFFLKEGPGTYKEVSDAIAAENYCPWGPSVADLNADGYEDTFIASGMNYPERYMINSVKLNDRGQRFVSAEFVLGVEPRSGGLATPWFELDASGVRKEAADSTGAEDEFNDRDNGAITLKTSIFRNS